MKYLIVGLLLSFSLMAGPHIKVRALGSSYKGKYIALEEYGLRPGNIPYARIQVIDVWVDKKMVDIEAQSQRPGATLEEVREQIQLQAREKAEKYKIYF